MLCRPLNLGKPRAIRPGVGRHFHALTAFVVGAEDLDAVGAGFAHFAVSDFLAARSGSPIAANPKFSITPAQPGAVNSSPLLGVAQRL
jgi:hypothetical protein